MKTLGKFLAAIPLVIIAAIASVFGLIGFGLAQAWRSLTKSFRSQP